MRWQPIETAPKDGTRVLLHYAGRHPCVGHWVERKTYDNGELKYAHAGWSTPYPSFVLMGDRSPPGPTHWMEIPPLG